MQSVGTSTSLLAPVSRCTSLFSTRGNQCGSFTCGGMVWLVLPVLMAAVFPWSSSGVSGPEEGWALAYPECRERNQSPVNIVDQDTKVSAEYQELTLEGFDIESSNKTSMKNTGKTGEDHTDTVYVCAHAETGDDCSRTFSGTQRSMPVSSTETSASHLPPRGRLSL